LKTANGNGFLLLFKREVQTEKLFLVKANLSSASVEIIAKSKAIVTLCQYFDITII
jgi:hypothetical protein